jgi:hypothetical protein
VSQTPDLSACKSLTTLVINAHGDLGIRDIASVLDTVTNETMVSLELRFRALGASDRSDQWEMLRTALDRRSFTRLHHLSIVVDSEEAHKRAWKELSGLTESHSGFTIGY